MQNYFKSNKVKKYKHFTKQLFSSVHTKSFVNSIPNMNVIQRKKCTQQVHLDEISKSKNIFKNQYFSLKKFS